MSLTPRIEPLFATPLIVEMIPDHEVERQTVAAVVSAAATAGGMAPGGSWSGSGGIRPDGLQKLIRRIGDAANRNTADIRYPHRSIAWQTRIGGHVAARQGPIEIAPSYDAFWSTIYVADDGYAGSRDPGAGGELIFHDPRLPAPMMEMPDLRLRMEIGRANAIYTPEIAVRPATGYLLLYPGWLRVSMRPLRVAGPRLMVGVSLVAPLDSER